MLTGTARLRPPRVRQWHDDVRAQRVARSPQHSGGVVPGPPRPARHERPGRAGAVATAGGRDLHRDVEPCGLHPAAPHVRHERVQDEPRQAHAGAPRDGAPPPVFVARAQSCSTGPLARRTPWQFTSTVVPGS